jgi:16S rRNA processing protein RimM
LTELSAGRVGRAHGRDGSFYVDDPSYGFPEEARVRLAGVERAVERRAGTDERPLIRLSGISDRESAVALRGATLVVDRGEATLGEGEYRVSELVGCEVSGLGRVERVLESPSCDLLEIGPDAVLVPLVGDAIARIDLAARRIEINREFLDL